MTYNYGTPEALGEPTSVTDPLNRTTSFAYNAYGYLTSVMDALGNVTSMEYNDAGQLTKTTYPITNQTGSGQAYTKNTYLYVGGPCNKTQLYREDGTLEREVNRTAGAEDETKSVTGSVVKTAAVYDNQYRVSNLQDGNMHGTGSTFDSVGNLSKLSFPKSAGAFDTVTPAFDPDHNLMSMIDGKSRTTTVNRVSNDSSVTSVGYSDGTTPNVNYIYDGYNRVTTVTTTTVSQTFAYDDNDLVTSVITTFPGVPAQTTTFAYNPDGSRATMVIPSGTYAYTYDNAGELRKVQTPWNTSIYNEYYDNGWLIRQRTSLIEGDRVYNARGQLISLANYNFRNTANTTSFFSGMRYDGLGNRTSVYWDINSVIYDDTAGAKRFSTRISGAINYTYDDKSRLVSETDNRLAFGTGGNNYYYIGNLLNASTTNANNYVSDAANNLTTIRSVGSQGYNEDNQITNASVTYDGDGSPINYPVNTAGTLQTLVHDQEDRMTSIPSAFTMGYYPDGRRAWKQIGSTRYYYLYDGDSVVYEMSSTGVATNLFGYGAGGLSQRKVGMTGTLYFYTFDPSGNVVQRHTVGSTLADFTTIYDGFGQQLGCISSISGTQAATGEKTGFAGGS